jgi:hypothetical protein
MTLGRHRVERQVAFAFAVGMGLTGTAAAYPMNEAPPTGAIFDLYGQPINHGAPETYTVEFTATVSHTTITFMFRDDNGYIYMFNPTVVDTSGGLITTLAKTPFTVGKSGWAYGNTTNASFGGYLTSSCESYGSSCWKDGAVQGYDALDKTVLTTVGHTYEISFQVTESSGINTWSRVSTNGNSVNIGGNGVDMLVYAQGVEGSGGGTNPPDPPAVPEPSTWALTLLGFAGAGLLGYRTRRMGREAA